LLLLLCTLRLLARLLLHALKLLRPLLLHTLNLWRALLLHTLSLLRALLLHSLKLLRPLLLHTLSLLRALLLHSLKLLRVLLLHALSLLWPLLLHSLKLLRALLLHALSLLWPLLLLLEPLCPGIDVLSLRLGALPNLLRSGINVLSLRLGALPNLLRSGINVLSLSLGTLPNLLRPGIDVLSLRLGALQRLVCHPGIILPGNPAGRGVGMPARPVHCGRRRAAVVNVCKLGAILSCSHLVRKLSGGWRYMMLAHCRFFPRVWPPVDAARAVETGPVIYRHIVNNRTVDIGIMYHCRVYVNHCGIIHKLPAFPAAAVKAVSAVPVTVVNPAIKAYG
jgi:hypothetical protein